MHEAAKLLDDDGRITAYFAVDGYSFYGTSNDLDTILAVKKKAGDIVTWILAISPDMDTWEWHNDND